MYNSSIADLKHPLYDERYRDWTLWRDTYEGGPNFITKYVKKFSARESPDDYARRQEVTYNPAFAKGAVDEIKNSIFSRLVDISRRGGSQSYNDAVSGLKGGVDLVGSSMNSFIGRKILPELLTMSRVGVYVDMPPVAPLTKADERSLGVRPYVYIYRTEDIRSWCYDEDSNGNEFSNILLCEHYNTFDARTGLPNGNAKRYRRMWLGDGCVHVQFYADNGDEISSAGEKASDSTIELPITRIPFILLELSDSLLAEVAKYQVALLNLCSSDMSYALSANFPFYTEQFEPRAQNEFARKPGPATGGEAPDGTAAKTEEVRVGVSRGRRYPKGMERPGFIHPSSEPLKASMEKQEQMKAEIRQLVNLAVTNLSPKMASAESKGMDRQGLESGLSYIGLELENAERKIAEYWAMYEKSEPATINYPTNYSVMTEAERRKEAQDLRELLTIIPSRTYQRAIHKRIAELTVSRQLDADSVDKINREIDASDAMTADPEVIFKSIETGTLDLELGSSLLGYPKGTVDKAAKDHTDRLDRIAKSQAKNNDMINGAARGVPDLGDGTNQDIKDEKKAGKDTTQDDTVKKKVRGEGEKIPSGE